MKVLNPKFDLDAFFEHVRQSPKRTLLLDFDGTLAPFQIARNRVRLYPGVREILQSMLQAQHTHLAIVSGRALRDLRPLIDIEPLPELWGSHAMERLRTDGKYEKVELGDQEAAVLQSALTFLERAGYRAQAEKKPGSVALHWRGKGEDEIACLRKSVEREWQRLANGTHLEIREFDGGLELRSCIRSKGKAVDDILSEIGDEGAAAYLGDDLTDEDAFDAIKGKGLAILVRETRRPTSADLWLKPPRELIDFLTHWNTLCEE